MAITLASELQALCAASNLNDFQDVVEFLKTHLDDVINEVHSMDKLLISDGTTSINCPPAPEKGDSHGGMLIHTVSEQEADGGEARILSREFKVHDMGPHGGVDHSIHDIEIRCDVKRMNGDVPQLSEEKVTIQVTRTAKV